GYHGPEVLEVPADVRHVVEEDGGALVIRITAELRMSLGQACELPDVAGLTALVVQKAQVELSPLVFAVAGTACQGTVGLPPRAEAVFGGGEQERTGPVRERGLAESLFSEHLRRHAVRRRGVVAQVVALQAKTRLGGLLVRKGRGQEQVGRPLRRKLVT